MVLAFVVLAGSLAWLGRERIAANLIEDTLANYGLEASYEIESIGARRQVIRNLVVGDPARPDFTAERVTLALSYTYGPPDLGQIELTRPRLFGEFTDGALSFGSLDALLFAESEEPARLPTYNVRIIDGRARIASDYGVIGAKLDGEGAIDDGFAGTLAATAPGLGVEGCSATGATAFGDLTSDQGRLSFDGPLRLRELSCEGARVATADVGAVLTLAGDLASLEGDLALDGSGLSFSDMALNALGGSADFALAFGEQIELSLRHDISGKGLRTGYANAARIASEGTLRSQQGFARNEWTGRITGDAIDAGGFINGAGLAEARAAGEGTLVGSLLGKLERGLGRGLLEGAFAADVSVRTTSDTVRVVVPEARLSSAAGETLLAMSRVSYASAGEGQPETLSGNILTGGADLPRINARLSQRGSGNLALRMSIAEYREGADAISIPRLEARRNAAGAVQFDGTLLAQGAVPGGRLQGLVLPVEGRWSPASGLALGTQCGRAQIAGVQAYDFDVRQQTLTVCPDAGGAIVRYRDDLQIAARVDEIELSGSLGESPAAITASSASLRYPGGFALTDLTARIGASGEAVRFDAARIDGELGDVIGGSIEGANASLDFVPLDISELSGEWSFADNVLALREGAFTVTERVEPGAVRRIEPLASEGASLTFADGMVLANAELFHPATSRGVANIALRHDLSSGIGSADFTVPGLGFDEAFQPDDLTSLTKGLIAFADGVIEGEGRLDWNGSDIDSTGTFSTQGFDFAAAFGPVRGLSGTIEFTDLLAMTTAPNQVATIASVNPGIEALDGRIVYSITNGTVIEVNEGRWPFMGGELMLRPVTLDYGGGQGQSYIFEIIALDAATFVAQMELSNLSATGQFDGTIPIIFDAQGNGTIAGGLLISRPPGGNVSYVGELTYEDLGAMGNYAFQTLRSLDYNQMSIELNGNLAGEIITNFNIDGVRQGAGASKNFVTRQLAKLPIRFKINVRSENFYLLATIVRGLFDPTVFGDPIDQGLLQIDGNRIVPRESVPSPAPTPDPTPQTPSVEAERREDSAVQPPESDEKL